MNIEKLDQIDTGRYGFRSTEMLQIYNKFQGLACDCMVRAFKLGFLRGQRAAENKRKRESKETADQSG